MADDSEAALKALSMGGMLGDLYTKYRPLLPSFMRMDPGSVLQDVGGSVAALAPETGSAMQRAGRIIAGQGAQIPTDLASAPFALYSLANMGVNYAKDKPLDAPTLPGSGGAMAVNSTLNAAGQGLGEAVSGEPTKTDLSILNPIKNYGEDPVGHMAHLSGSLLRIAGGLPPAPAAVANAGAKAAAAVATGIKAIDYPVKGALFAIEAATPLMMNPSKTSAAVNLGAGAGIIAGLEHFFDDKKSDGMAKVGAERASEAINVAGDTKRQIVAAAGIPSTGDWLADASIGVVGAATLGYLARRAGIGATKKAVPSYWDETSVVPADSKLKSIMSDRNEPLKSTFKNSDAEKVAEFEAAVDRRATPAAVQTMIEHTHSDGVLPTPMGRPGAMAMHVTPTRILDNEMLRLGDQRAQMVRDLLNYRTEFDNRMNNLFDKYPSIQRVFKPGGVYDMIEIEKHARKFPDSEIAVNLFAKPHPATGAMTYTGGPAPGMTTHDLIQQMKSLKSDPDVYGVVGQIDKNLKTMSDYIVQMGLRSRKDVDSFMRINPNYAPMPVEVGNNLWLRNRTAQSGLPVMGDSYQAYRQYQNDIISQALREDKNRAWMMNAIKAYDANEPWARQTIGASLTPDKYNAQLHANHFVPYRTRNGDLMYREVKDPLIRAAMKAPNPEANKTFMAWADGMRRAVQYMASGPGTLIAGAPMAPIVNMTTTQIASTLRPQGARFGMIDSLLQNVTGGKVGLPGDPTAHLLSWASAGRDVGSVMARALQYGLERSIMLDGTLSKILGPQTAKHIADTMKRFYDDSAIKEMQRLGVSHQATTGTYDSFDKGMIPHLQRLKTAGVSHSTLRETVNVVHQIYNVIGNAPITAMMRQNKGRMSDDRLAGMLRNAAGDAGKHPLEASAFTSKGTQIASSATRTLDMSAPYYNIMVQAMTKLATEFKRDPYKVGTGILMSTAIPAAMATAWNVQAGPEYVDYQFNRRGSDKAASGFYIAVPGLAPEHGIEWRNDQSMRPFNVLASHTMGMLFGLYDGSIFKPENAMIRERFSDMYWPRLKQDMGAAVDQMVNIPMPPIVSSGAAAMGFKIDDITPTKGWSIKPMMPSNANGFDDQAKSRFVNDNVFGLQLDARFDEIMRAHMAVVGTSIAETMRTVSKNLEEGGSKHDAAKDVVQQYGMRAKDRMPMLNGLLWEQSPKLSPVDVTSKVLSGKIKGLQSVSEALDEFAKAGAVGTAKRGYSPLEGATAAAPLDPEMLELGRSAKQLSTQLSSHFMGKIKDEYAQITSIQSSTALTPQSKRKAINDHIDNIRKLQGDALDVTRFWEGRLSERFGRDIKFEEIKLEKGMDQFKRQ